jgi:hypothetical protein
MKVDKDAFLDGKSWEITANNDATLLYESEANDYIKDGYWVDYETDENGTSTSLRGSSSLTGTADNLNQTILVMIPENTGSDSRTVELSVKINNKKFDDGAASITQLAAVDGWEQISEGGTYEFGFNWTREVYYGYVYNGYYTHRRHCQNIINNNDASGYAETYSYDYDGTWTRCAIRIKYSNMCNLVSNSESEGLQNTETLRKKVGNSAPTAFENYVASIKKTERGKTGQNAFRKGDGSSGEAPASTGTFSNGSTGLDECLKKNKYHIQWKKITNTEENVDELGSTLVLDELVWYLPAVNEFENPPVNLKESIEPSEYWSSTVIEGSTYAYSGSNLALERSTTLKIRAKRK